MSRHGPCRPLKMGPSCGGSAIRLVRLPSSSRIMGPHRLHQPQLLQPQHPVLHHSMAGQARLCSRSTCSQWKRLRQWWPPVWQHLRRAWLRRIQRGLEKPSRRYSSAPQRCKHWQTVVAVWAAPKQSPLAGTLCKVCSARCLFETNLHVRGCASRY